MKQTALFKIILGIVALSVLYSCGKKCSDKVCDAPGGPVLLDLRDSQDRDLLNPATPGAYDTTAIKTLNKGQVLILPVGYAYASHPERIKLVLGDSFGDAPTKLYLSETVSKTVYTEFVPVSKNCCTYFDLKSFTYDGKSYTDSLKSRYFIIKN